MQAKLVHCWIPLCLSIALSACMESKLSHYPLFAPVTDGMQTADKNTRAPVINPQQPHTNAIHKVVRGDTLYSVAWRYHMDFRVLAALNHIIEPYAIYPGQRLLLQTQSRATVANESAPAGGAAKASWIRSSQAMRRWEWPVKGQLTQSFTLDTKGIDISGKLGQPVKAASDGLVVYSGTGLRGYGPLIILKHNDDFLSAYAHNQRLLVKEGETVKRGQVIATMGRSGTKQAVLHFEIRKSGVPVNPLNYLAQGRKPRVNSYVG